MRPPADDSATATLCPRSLRCSPTALACARTSASVIHSLPPAFGRTPPGCLPGEIPVYLTVCSPCRGQNPVNLMRSDEAYRVKALERFSRALCVPCEGARRSGAARSVVGPEVDKDGGW